MSFGSSSSVNPTASSAASFAIGKPVAFDASAEERETRGFISITRYSPLVGMHGELDVGAARRDADRAGGGERGLAKLLVDRVGQRLLRRDRPGVAGVNAHRVEVLDRADDDGVPAGVAHHLELVLLPALEVLLDEHLVDRARGEAAGDRDAQLLGRPGDAAAGAAEREGRPDDRRAPGTRRRASAR